MSDPDAGRGHNRRDTRHVPPEWSAETGDSVFGPGRGSSARRVPPPPGAPPARPGEEPTVRERPSYGGAGEERTVPQRPAYQDDGERTMQAPSYRPPDQGYGQPAGYGGAYAGGGYGQPGGGYGPQGYDQGAYGRQPYADPRGAGGPMAPQPRYDQRARRDAYDDQDDRRSRDRGRGGGGGIGFPFGFGTLVGVIGAACVVAALTVLPWFEVGGQEVLLEDMRTAFSLPETDGSDLIGSDPETTTPPTTGDGGLPTPGEVGDAIQDEVTDAAGEAAASAIDTGKARYLELYVDTLWWIVAAVAVLAVVFSTILTPRSFALGLLLGFRRISGSFVVLAAIAHGVALWIVFTGDGAPTPAQGVYIGAGGLAAVLLACIIGPKH